MEGSAAHGSARECFVLRSSLGRGGGWRAQIKDHDLSHSLCNSILLLPCLMVLYIVSVLFLLFLSGVLAWRLM